MAEIAIKPLLAHRPEISPPAPWRLFLLPALLALLGIALATAAATWGQHDALTRAQLQIANNRLQIETDLLKETLKREARAPDADPAKIVRLGDALAIAKKQTPSWYQTAPGAELANWDGYRYGEIIDAGYLYHQPTDPDDVRNSSVMTDPRTGERRLKNIVWYPLYPLLGLAVKTLTGLPTHRAMTLTSQLCLMAACLVLFALARRHFHTRMPMLSDDGADHVSRRWDLVPADTAALWTVAFVVFNPDGIFFCANYTESLFILLLGLFLWFIQGRHWWAAAVVAMIASSCRSQGVLFGPVLAVTYLMRADTSQRPTRRVYSVASVALLVAAWLGALTLYGKRALETHSTSLGSGWPTWAWVATWVLLLAVGGAAVGVHIWALHRRYDWAFRLAGGITLSAISALGLLAYMAYLQATFQDPLAFMHAQQYWHVGINTETVRYALNPINPMTNFFEYVFRAQTDWPRLWEAFCVLFPPVLLMLLGARFLSFEQELIGWILWGLPYVSNALAPSNPLTPPLDLHWMSMGRFMAAALPLYLIVGAVLVRFRWLAPVLLGLAATAFGLFAYKFGAGIWVG